MAVDRDGVAEDDVDPGAQPAREREPGRQGGGHGRAAGDVRAEGGRRVADVAAPRGGHQHHQPQSAREQHGVRLQADGGAQRQPGAGEAPRPAPPFEPAHDAQRADDEKHAHEEIPLARLPGPAGEVVGGEREGGAGGGNGAPARGEQRHRAGRRGQPGEIERAPRGIARAERAQQRQVQDVHAGLVDVVEVAVRHVTFADPPGDVVHDGRVLDERPGQREHEEDRDEQAEGDDHHRAGERRRAHQMVLGSRYRCWSRPSTPRGISSTTATMMAPKSSGWK